MIADRGGSKLRQVVVKFAAIVALVALLLPGISSLAETLSASSLPACCNTAFCPVHHRQASNLQRDKSNCATMGVPGQEDCSMRACDAATIPAVGSVVFVLVAPLSLRGPLVAEAAPAPASHFFPAVTAIPLTPPPRTFPS